jgi:4-alpha-glucanotransferase
VPLIFRYSKKQGWILILTPKHQNIMMIKFNLHFITHWGQQLFLCKYKGEKLTESIPMEYAGGSEWQLTIDYTGQEPFEFRFALKHSTGRMDYEWGKNRFLMPIKDANLCCRHFWRSEQHPDNLFHTKAFTEVLMKPKINLTHASPRPNLPIIRFELNSPRIPQNCSIAITGNQPALGNWDAKKALMMNATQYPMWTTEISREEIEHPIRYKYLLINNTTHEVIEWEAGEDRQFNLSLEDSATTHWIQSDDYFRFQNANWRAAGVAIPVFSLRTATGFGVGEFADLSLLTDWAVQSGLKMIQILPVNETVATHSWMDSYPYKSISVLALHPVYLNINKIGSLKDTKLMAWFETQRERLNESQFVDYVEVHSIKSRYYKHIFDQNWEETQKQESYRTFFLENKEWLELYAAFCYLRDQFKTADFRQWGEWYPYHPEKIAKLVDPSAPHHEHIAVHYFIQYHLDLQLREAIDYAHSKGVALKGDIPIGISPNSIEAWTEPELFNMNGQAGAPPDDFAVLGQNWGFPTYNWELMEKDGYAWWKKRLSMMSKYFDAYRIDHILGFFRIWEIPKDSVHGLLGYFKPGLPLSTSEIGEFGIRFDEQRYTKPYIRNHFLPDLFGEQTADCIAQFLNESQPGEFELRQEFDSQIKIENQFSTENIIPNHLNNNRIKDGLMRLTEEVLFVKEPNSEPPVYHPRIAFHSTYSYRDLDAWTREQLNLLYDHYFYHRHDEFWKEQGLNKLPIIMEASDMLVCGEDLGMVPHCVPDVLHKLQILSLEIQRMPKNPKVKFGHPADAPYQSVITTSTHDMSTLRAWWEEDREKTQQYFHRILHHVGIPPHFAEPWICREIISQHMHSPAMWAIFPFQDLLAMDGELRWDEIHHERINVPSNPINHWKYRMNLSLEQLIETKSFSTMLKEMIEHAHREI